MKVVLLMLLCASVSAVSVYAQKYYDEPAGVVLDDTGPVVNPDMMTYFQEEMISLIRYQDTLESKDDYSGFFVSFRMIYSLEEPVNNITNALIGGHFEINNALSIPLFGAMTLKEVGGAGDTGGMVVNGFPVKSGSMSINDASWEFFPGSGLSFRSPFFQGSIFVGDHIRIANGNRSMLVYNAEGDTDWHFLYDDGVTHSVKVALVPVVYTSQWRGVGRVLNKALGYIGMGDLIAFGEEKKDAAADTMVKALNFALDLSFKSLSFGNMGWSPTLFYHRDHYDVAAKTDDYGVRLELLGGRKLNYLFTATLGYRQFCEVSPYFRSNYSDTYFYKFNFAFYLRPDAFSFFGGLKVNVFCDYDAHKNFTYGFTFGIRDALTTLFEYKGFETYPHDIGVRWRGW
jgi:hypothetical protein